MFILIFQQFEAGIANAPFYVQSKLCKTTPATPTEKLGCYETETNFSSTRRFQLAKSSDRIIVYLFKNQGFCVRALRCHKGSGDRL